MKKAYTTFALFFALFTFSFTLSNAQTYFSDNFETGLGNWIVGGNNWDTLSTAYTPPNHCVTDSRIGNYSVNSNPIITMSATLNLTGTTFPVLTFSHAYSLRQGNGCGTDYINVDISTNGGFNWSNLRSWAGTNNAWTFEQINLRNFRTNLFKIRFSLSAYSGCAADGWYIDDVKILEYITLNPTISLPFSDNFETGMGKWIRGGFNWDTTSSTYTSPNHSATDSRIGNYSINSNPIITISGVLNLSNTISPELTFFHRYALRQGNGCGTDYINVDISTNGGFNWSNLRSLPGTNVAWTYADPFDLSAYRRDSVKIRFSLSAYSGCEADGWYIDDVSIRDIATEITNINSLTPDKFSLNQNYPNPFNPVTNIEFSIPKQSNVKISVYDSQGKEVVTLLNKSLNAGTYIVDFDGMNYSSGVYFYKMESESFVQTKSMVLIK